MNKRLLFCFFLLKLRRVLLMRKIEELKAKLNAKLEEKK